MLLPVLLALIVVLTLYLPPIQQWGAGRAAHWLQEHTDYTLSFERVRIHFPLRLRVDALSLAYGDDTLAVFDHVHTEVLPYPLWKGRVAIPYLQVDGGTVHADSLLRGVLLDASVPHLRLEDIDYVWDTRSLQLHDISVHGAEVHIVQYLVEQRDSSSPTSFPLSLSVDEALLTDVSVDYTSSSMAVHTVVPTASLDCLAVDTLSSLSLYSAAMQGATLRLASGDKGVSEVDIVDIHIRADSVAMTAGTLRGLLSRLSFRESHGFALQEGSAHIDIGGGMVRLPDFAFRTEASAVEGHLRTVGRHAGVWTLDGDVQGTIGRADMQHLAALYPDALDHLLTLYPASVLSFEVAVDGPLNALQLSRCRVSSPTVLDISMTGTIGGLPEWRTLDVHTVLDATFHDIDFLSALLDTAMQHRLVIPPDILLDGTLHYTAGTMHTQLALSFDGGMVEVGGEFSPDDSHYSLAVQTAIVDMHAILPRESLGLVFMQASVDGVTGGWDTPDGRVDCIVTVDSLMWADRVYSNAHLEASLHDRHLQLEATYVDTLVRIHLRGDASLLPGQWGVDLYTTISDANLKGWGIAEVDIRPSFGSHLSLVGDTSGVYTLQAHFYDIVLSSPERTIHPMSIAMNACLTTDSVALSVNAGDLHLAGSACGAALPLGRMPKGEEDDFSALLSTLRVKLQAGGNNPLSNYLSLNGISVSSLSAQMYKRADCIFAEVSVGPLTVQGMEVDAAMLDACYSGGRLEARLHADDFSWHTGMMSLDGTVGAALVWHDAFRSDSLQGTARLYDVKFALPPYNLHLHTADTLVLPFREGTLSFPDVPLYAEGKQPLRINGAVALLSSSPSLRLRIDARNVSLLRPTPTSTSLLYGRAMLDGSVVMEGPLDALRLSGSLALRDGSSLYYIYKDASLTANRNLNEVVTFVDFSAPVTKPVPSRHSRPIDGFSMNLNVSIVSTVQLQVLLGTSGENMGTLQGGGDLNVQYIPATGLRLSGKYMVSSGELTMNIPLLHVHSMTIRPGSTVQWSGNMLNPMLDVVAEDRIRASVTIDEMPQTILFVAGVSLSDTMERLGLQFTLSAPENASMQNLLASLSPDERSKLAVALLTTGLYLGEGGTGNLMNTALLGFLQSQLDNISRDTFRSVDVSFGIEPLQDGVSGISTRTDYSFSVAKRFWRDRIRVVIGGSVTTSNERIEDNAIIDNISVEWRLAQGGNQYLRFFYDKNFESILEGEIRETGVGYVYRRRF